MGALSIGVDVGQRQDPTAIVVSETDRRRDPFGQEETHHLVRFLQRLPLGTDYRAMASRVVEVSRAAAQLSGVYPTIYVDATGVGLGICDLLATADLGAKLVKCFLTSGDKRVLRPDGREVSVGKIWLLYRLQGLFQAGKVHLPQGTDADGLREELQDYEIRTSEAGHMTTGAFRTGAHDDLVTALGLATQLDDVAPAMGMLHHRNVRGERQPIPSLEPRTSRQPRTLFNLGTRVTEGRYAVDPNGMRVPERLLPDSPERRVEAVLAAAGRQHADRGQIDVRQVSDETRTVYRTVESILREHGYREVSTGVFLPV